MSLGMEKHFFYAICTLGMALPPHLWPQLKHVNSFGNPLTCRLVLQPPGTNLYSGCCWFNTLLVDTERMVKKASELVVETHNKKKKKNTQD